MRLLKSCPSFFILSATLLLSLPAHAEIHPVLLKDDPEMYARIYFGMPYEEFRTRLGAGVTECRQSIDRSVADITCRIGIRFGGEQMSEATGLFHHNALVAVIGKFDAHHHAMVGAALTGIYGEPSQVVASTEKKPAADACSYQLKIWSYQDYLMYYSRPTTTPSNTHRPDFDLANESDDGGFIEKMRAESQRSSRKE